MNFRRCSALSILIPALSALLIRSIEGAPQGCLPSQISVEGPPFFEAWVDPSQGNDTNAMVSTPSGSVTVAQAKAAPFQTINAAIGAVFNVVNPPGNPGIVHLEPATYDPSTQTFPIIMRNGVNVQGVSARECVLREGGIRSRDGFSPDDDCECGFRQPTRMIVDFSSSFALDAPVYSEMIDGVTFQGGGDNSPRSGVQVYVDGENPIEGRISNCIFDMIDYTDFDLPGPEFGVLMVHEWHPDVYQEINMDIFNNTFVMGWLPNGYESPFVFACSPTAVGICDTSDPLCPDGDDDTELHYVGTSNIQNNLFRELHERPSTALLSIPDLDTKVSTGTPTNIFLNATTPSNGPYCVALRGLSLAVPAVTYNDPAHVGEMLTNHLGLNLQRVGRDWRLLPDSLAVNKGVAPTNGVLAALNGLTYTEPSVVSGCTFSPIDSFDFDGEGYGNRRVIGQIDVGYDEFEKMIESGYGNESLAIPTGASPCTGVPGDPCYCIPFGGSNLHRFIVNAGGSPPAAPFLTLRIKTAACPSTAYTIQPGALLPPNSVGSSLFWFGPPFTTVGPLMPAVTTYTPPDSTGPNTQSFGIVTRSVTNAGQFRQFQGQVGSGANWSGLQPSFD